jgi:FkbM family methyltransferase
MSKSLVEVVGSFGNKVDSRLRRPIVVIDIGCRWGFADRFLHHISDLQLYGFDPDKSECERLDAKYSHENIHLIPHALAEKSGKYDFYETLEPACSSIFRPHKHLTDNYPSLKCAEMVKESVVDAVSLDDWATGASVEYADYLKLDTQGSELDILRGAIMLLETVRLIELEVQFNPMYDGAASYSDIDQFLRERGFVLWNFSTLVHYGLKQSELLNAGNLRVAYDEHDENIAQRGGQLFWGDACYVRKDMLDREKSAMTTQGKNRDIGLMEILNMPDLLATIQESPPD